MAQHGIEMILMRRLAGLLRMPIVLVDVRGDLVFWNAGAAAILGRRFEDAGAIQRGGMTALFQPAHLDGSAMKREEMPLFIATERREPSHRRALVRGLDGVVRDFDGIAFPLIGQAERLLGAVGVFWHLSDPPLPGARRAGEPLDLARPGGDRPIELLLARQLASYLRTAMFLVGPDGCLLFFNEPAERLLGRRFDEADQMGAEEWSTLLDPWDEEDRPIALEERPMLIALWRQHPEHRRYSVRTGDGARQPIEGLAFPLVNGADRQLGAVGIFWEPRAT